MSDGTSRASSSAAPASPGARWCSGPMPLNRCVTIARAGVGRRPCTVEVDGRVTRARRRRRVRASVACRGQPGIGFGRERHQPDEVAERVDAAAGPSRDRRAGAGPAGGRRGRRRGTVLRGARRAPHRARARARRRARSRIASYASSGALQIVSSNPVVPPRDERVDRADDLARRDAVAKSTPPAPFTCMSTNPGASSASPRSSAPAVAAPEPVATIAAVRDRDPRRARRLAAFAVEDARRNEASANPGCLPQRPAESAQSAQRTGHAREERAARRPELVHVDRDLARSAGRPRSTRRISSVSNRSWPNVLTRAYGSTIVRGASP